MNSILLHLAQFILYVIPFIMVLFGASCFLWGCILYLEMIAYTVLITPGPGIVPVILLGWIIACIEVKAASYMHRKIHGPKQT